MKKNRVPQGLNIEKNLLRYELRLIKWLSKNFKGKEVLVSDLFDFGFCNEILKIWGQNYFSIKKNNIVGLDLRSISNQKDYLDFLLLRGIEAHRENIVSDIKFLKSINAFKTKEYYSRLLSKIDRIGTNPQIISESPLNKELDNKINLMIENLF